MKRAILPLALLTATYALTLASAELWDLVGGLLLAVLLLIGFRRFVFSKRPLAGTSFMRRIIAFFPFAAAVLGSIVRGTWQVTLIVMHLRPLRRPGIVAVPIGARTRLGVGVTTLVVTLSPGSFLVDVDWPRRLMLFHVIDASDPDAIRAEYENLYQRYQRAVFP